MNTIHFDFHSACTTLALAQVRLRLGTSKMNTIHFDFHSACTTLALAQVRLRLGTSKMNTIHFDFHSACTNFAPEKTYSLWQHNEIRVLKYFE